MNDDRTKRSLAPAFDEVLLLLRSLPALLVVGLITCAVLPIILIEKFGARMLSIGKIWERFSKPKDPELPRAVVADTAENRSNKHWAPLIGRSGVVMAVEAPLDDGERAVTWKMDGDELPHVGVRVSRFLPGR